MDEAATTNHPIKIFFVSNSCWSIYNFRSDVIEHFIKLGYEVHVAALKDDFAIKLLNIGCKVHEIKFNNRKLNPLADISFLFELKALYRKVKPDMIFHYVIKYFIAFYCHSRLFLYFCVISVWNKIQNTNIFWYYNIIIMML